MSDVMRRVTPKIINQNTDQYVIGHCKCPLDTRYALGVNVNDLTLEEKKQGVCSMYCPNCNTHIEVAFRFGWEVTTTTPY